MNIAMGLASYGKSDAKDIDCYSPEVSSQVLRKHPKVLSPFDYPSNSDFIYSFTGTPQRAAIDTISDQHIYLAQQLQYSLVDKVLSVMKTALDLTDERNIVYAGGVASNCSANKLVERI